MGKAFFVFTNKPLREFKIYGLLYIWTQILNSQRLGKKSISIVYMCNNRSDLFL